MKRLQAKHLILVSICTLSSKIFSGGGIDLINLISQIIPGG